MTSTDLVDILNSIVSRFQATHIWFETDSSNSISMYISSKRNGERTYWYHWPTVERCLALYTLEPNTFINCSADIFTALKRVYKTMHEFPDNKSYLINQNDMQFLKVISTCNSLEELQIKTDLYGV